MNKRLSSGHARENESFTPERYCLTCSKILTGRIDKKFCNDRCRSAYNNQLIAPVRSIVRMITIALRKNRKILLHFAAEEGEVGVRKKELLLKGSNFTYITHVKQNQEKTWFFCFECGYRIEENECVIVKTK